MSTNMNTSLQDEQGSSVPQGKMTAEQFCYWLQGFVELHGGVPTTEQWESIKEHLGLAFTKVTHPVKVTFRPVTYPSTPGTDLWGYKVSDFPPGPALFC